MKTKIFQNSETRKIRKYNMPEVTVIKIDNDISLVMMSADPNNDPPETFVQSDHFIANPFKLSKL